jgi:hypothetical protein
MRILTNLKGGPLVKLVKGEGRATRARSLAAPRWAEARRVDRDRDREAYALFLSFMSVIHVNHNLLY